MKNVMIDLETMSLRPDAAIISIGAVVFEPHSKCIIDEYHRNVDLSSCISYDLRVDDSTTAWWARQDRDLRDNLTKDTLRLTNALVEFTDWIMHGVIDHTEIVPWSNGAGFDIPILENAYEAIGIKPPWTYKNISCYRTLRRMYRSVHTEFTGQKHNPLDDARNQARHLMEIMAIMSKPGDLR